MSKILLIAVDEGASASDWAHVNETLRLFSNGQGVVVPRSEGAATQASEPKQPSERKMTPAESAAHARAVKAQKQAERKASEQTHPSGPVDRMALLAGKVAQSEPTRQLRAVPSETRTSNLFASDVSDPAFVAIVSFRDNVVVQDRKDALTAWLEGKCPLSDLGGISTSKGTSTLALDVLAKVERADKAAAKA